MHTQKITEQQSIILLKLWGYEKKVDYSVTTYTFENHPRVRLEHWHHKLRALYRKNSKSKTQVQQSFQIVSEYPEAIDAFFEDMQIVKMELDAVLMEMNRQRK